MINFFPTFKYYFRVDTVRISSYYDNFFSHLVSIKYLLFTCDKWLLENRFSCSFFLDKIIFCFIFSKSNIFGFTNLFFNNFINEIVFNSYIGFVIWPGFISFNNCKTFSDKDFSLIHPIFPPSKAFAAILNLIAVLLNPFKEICSLISFIFFWSSETF